MSSGGQFHIARDIFYDWTTEDRPWCSLALWLYLIGRGQYKNTTVTYLGHSFPLTRGQLVTSASHLCEVAGWTPQRLRTFLSRCQKDGKITMTGSEKGTVISILNYDKWQGSIEQQALQQTKQQALQQTEKKSQTVDMSLEQQALQQTKQQGEQQQSIQKSLVSKEEKEKRFVVANKIDDDPVVLLYRRICVPAGLPDILVLTPFRIRAIKRITKDYGLERLEALFRRAITSKFLLGESSSKTHVGWRADFDFFLRAETLVYINEGSRYFDVPLEQSDPFLPVAIWTPEQDAKHKKEAREWLDDDKAKEEAR